VKLDLLAMVVESEGDPLRMRAHEGMKVASAIGHGSYLEPAGGRPRCSRRGLGASSWTRSWSDFSGVANAYPLFHAAVFRGAPARVASLTCP
jgi:hypothetical protein